MTLIVYSNDTLYADTSVIVQSESIYAHFTKGKKLYTDEEKTVAFGITGQVPHHSHLKNLSSSLSALARRYYIDFHLQKERVKLPGHIKEQGDKIFDSLCQGIYSVCSDSTILVMSRHDTFTVSTHGKENVERNLFWNDVEVAEGSGKGPFYLCRANGLSVEESYYEISRIDDGIDPNPDKIHRSELTPFGRKGKK